MNEIKIGEKIIGDGRPCYIIAEAGINHNGDLATAKKLVDAAQQAGADAVKFQKRQLKQLYREELLNNPQKGEQGLQYILPILVEYELTDEQFVELARYAQDQGTTFLCTPWDFASVDFLETLAVPAYKIGSPDMTNLPLIEYVIKTRKPLLMSTGMSTEAEIRCTLSFLKKHNASCGLFHCVSTYPASPMEINLRFMHTLREWSGFPVGYSGHDEGINISLGAVSMGACLLEKHLTLDKTMRGPDHKASLEPGVFAALVSGVREVEASMGVPHRWLTRGEVLNRRTLAKSIVTTRDMASGEVVTQDAITTKSPGLGLSPQLADKLIGRTLHRSIKRDDFFLDSDLHEPDEPTPHKKIDIGLPWGLIARFTDLDALLPKFQDSGMSLIEFHVSDRDLDKGLEGFRREKLPYEFVLHAPEYHHDHLIDLCDADEKNRLQSVNRIQKAIDLVRQLTPYFKPTSPRGPKMVFHVGGMSLRPGNYNLAAAHDRLLDSLKRLDHSAVDLLLENLPPFPWYFGGRWCGYVLIDAKNTVDMCRESGLGLCFDTSHAALACNYTGENLADFARMILPYLRHLHVSDGAGTSGEGLQIGEGQINFMELLPIFSPSKPTMVPEIWMGHHQGGKGFQIALEHLTDIVWAGRALQNVAAKKKRAELAMLTVPSSSDVLSALKAIDANKMGIAFITDEQRVVLGVVTDGDIRHGLARGSALHSPVIDIMTREFVFGTDKMNKQELKEKLPGRTRIMPVLDEDGRLTGVASDFLSDD